MYFTLSPLLVSAALVSAQATWPSGAAYRQLQGDRASHWKLSQFDSFLTFGDSYTDESRVDYFASHQGQAPPPGTVLPENLKTSSGGRTWPRYVVQYAGSKRKTTWDPRLSLYNYAVSGSVCSNKLTPRTFLPNFDFPSVREYELPAFQADLKATNPATGKPTFDPPLKPGNSVYSIWIGTNDLGADAFFTDSEVPGTSIVDYLDCVYDILDGWHAAGGRHFVIMNAAPLTLAPLYANASEGGISPAQASNYWHTGKDSNLTAVAEKMRQYVDLVNDVYAYRTPFESVLANRYPGAHLALYNVHDLLYNIHQNPSKYLNGSAPLNVTAGVHQCDDSGKNCVDNPSPDSFLWYDSLHPSEQADRVIAREFMHVLDGNSTYAAYCSNENGLPVASALKDSSAFVNGQVEPTRRLADAGSEPNSRRLVHEFERALRLLLDQEIEVIEWGDQVETAHGYPAVPFVYHYLVPDTDLDLARDIVAKSGLKRVEPKHRKTLGIYGNAGYLFTAPSAQVSRPARLHLLPQSLVHLDVRDADLSKTWLSDHLMLYRPRPPAYYVSLMKCIEDQTTSSFGGLEPRLRLIDMILVAAYKIMPSGKTWLPEEKMEAADCIIRKLAAIKEMESWSVREGLEGYRKRFMEVVESCFF